MSCYWDVHCKTCDEPHGFHNANRERDVMLHIIRHAAQLAAVAPLFRDDGFRLELTLPHSGRVDCDFFVRHLGHELVARSEYGDEEMVSK